MTITEQKDFGFILSNKKFWVLNQNETMIKLTFYKSMYHQYALANVAWGTFATFVIKWWKKITKKGEGNLQ